MVITFVVIRATPHPYPPANIASLSGAIKRTFGGSVSVKVLSLHRSDRNALKKIVATDPDIVGFTTFTALIPTISALSLQLKTFYRKPILWGAHHITALPKSLPRWVDIGVKGEAEATLVELLSVFLERRAFPREKLVGIPGICFYGEEGKWEETGVRSPPAIDLLDPPDYSGFGHAFWKPSQVWTRTGKKIRGTSVISTRGCAFRCTFCQESALVSRLRFQSPERFASQIEQLLNFARVEHINIEDSIFAYTPGQVDKICYALEKRGLLGRVTYSVQIAAPALTPEMAASFRNLRVNKVYLGLETGSPRMLRELKPGGDFSIEKNWSALLHAREAGLTTCSFFILGSPGETVDDMWLTHRFLKEAPVDRVGLSHFVPYPGTVQWAKLLPSRKVSDEMEWSQLDDEQPVDEAPYFNEATSREEFIHIFKITQKLVRHLNREASHHIRMKDSRQLRVYYQMKHAVYHAVQRVIAAPGYGRLDA